MQAIIAGPTDSLWNLSDKFHLAIPSVRDGLDLHEGVEAVGQGGRSGGQ